MMEKFAGTPYISKPWFPSDFPVNQSIGIVVWILRSPEVFLAGFLGGKHDPAMEWAEVSWNGGTPRRFFELFVWDTA